MTTALAKTEGATLTRFDRTRGLERAYPSRDEWQMIVDQAQVIWKSGIAEQMGLKNESQVTAIALRGWELRLPMMAALQGVHLIHGRPQLSAALMEAVAMRDIPGARLEWIDLGDKGIATVVAHRPGRKPITMSFSEEDAQASGAASRNPQYNSYPADMLRAGAARKACWIQYKDAYFGFEPGVVVVETEDGPEPADAPSTASEPAKAVPTTETTGQTQAAPGAPEDSVLPFKEGEWVGRTLSSLSADEMRRLARGYRRWLSTAPDSPQKQARQEWLDRVTSWAAHKGASLADSETEAAT